MNRHPFQRLSRRQMLQRCGLGFGSLAFTTMLAESEAAPGPLAPRQPRLQGKARRVIHLFMEGAPSHLDTFDPKPALAKYAGKPIPPDGESNGRTALPSPFQFARHGKSGIAISEIFPHLAKNADDLCVIRSMQTDEPNHEPAMLMMNCGQGRLARPSLGSWVNFGLGTENQNLPGFVALSPGNQPLQGASNWQSAFLPDIYQGTFIDTQGRRIEKLIEHIRSPHASDAEQRLQLDLLREINKDYARNRIDDLRLDARLQSFELAFRMQMAATDAFDISREPKRILDLYGATPQGRQLLLARRLLERGVRFVQAWQSGWDSHDNLAEEHRRLAQESDQAIAALLTDLKQRGLLDDTLVIWGGEFGRTPTKDGGAEKPGRDHNSTGFSMWLAGGGVKAGHVHGETDEFGFAAVKDKVHVHDLHATILRLLGFDHKKLTYRYAGRDFRLTDIHGEVIDGILA